jgi:GNAT superfamily N-acetyltransferase
MNKFILPTLTFKPINKEDLGTLLIINNNMIKRRKNPKYWVKGFNSFELSDRIINLLYEKSKENPGIGIIGGYLNEDLVGYTIMFFINKESRMKNIEEIIEQTLGKEVKSFATFDTNIIKDFIWLDDNPINLKYINDINYTFWFQIAVEQKYQGIGIGKALSNYVLYSSLLANSEFIFGISEIMPSLNFSDFNFLCQKMHFKPIAIVELKFTETGEKYNLLYRNIKL